MYESGIFGCCARCIANLSNLTVCIVERGSPHSFDFSLQRYWNSFALYATVGTYCLYCA